MNSQRLTGWDTWLLVVGGAALLPGVRHDVFGHDMPILPMAKQIEFSHPRFAFPLPAILCL